MPEKEYQRLARARSRTAFGAVSVFRSSLWLGKDHLLGIDSSGYTETYKRFYFRDIQAVTIVASKRRMIWNWVLGIPFAICALVLIVGLVDIWRRSVHSDDYWGFLGWGIPAGVFFTSLLINNLRGRACTCYLRTAVQIEELPSLSRVRRARKVLDRIRPLITAAQGSQPLPEELSARMQGLAKSFAGGSAAPGNAAAPSPAADNPNVPPRLA